VVFLSQGKILADGPPEAVFSDRSLAETYLGLV
jgi:ABC-type branched-subunit amino acid transport system ATPase component